MQSISAKAWAYAILFTFMAVVGNFTAKAVEYYMISQYTCNFVYAAIITMYALENWNLLMDVEYNQRHKRDTESHIDVIKKLTETNNILVQRNIKLKNEIMKMHSSEKTRGDDAIQCIINWRNIWGLKTNQPYSPLFGQSEGNIEESKNVKKLSTLSVKFQAATPKVPPINQEDSL